MSQSAKITVENMNLYYGKFHALKNINMEIPEKEITAFIGPSGCGKSTLLKSLNRMNDLVEGCVITGKGPSFCRAMPRWTTCALRPGRNGSIS